MLLLLLLPVALLLPSTLGDDKIIAGREIANNSIPYLASVNIEIFGHVRKRCAGFLIREDVVMTAAHCYVRFRDLNKLSVVLGAHSGQKSKANSQKIEVRHQIVHPKYRWKTKHNDIMLLQLDQKARLNNQVQLIGLPAAGEAVQAGAVCSVVGWGGRRLWTWKPSNVLLQVALLVRRDEVCEKAFYTYNAQVQMCAGDSSSKRATLRVDAEGALVCNGTAHGILSYRHRRRAFPQVFAKVSSFIPWIQSELKKLKP